MRETRQLVSRNPCIFFLQPRGCKKVSNCDFSHVEGQSYTVVKIRKLCRNSTGCTWKPRCKYVHPEDGEVIPARPTREGGSGSQPRQAGFGTQDCSQAPPGYTMQHFPGLGQPQRPEMFRPWMEPQARQ